MLKAVDNENAGGHLDSDSCHEMLDGWVRRYLYIGLAVLAFAGAISSSTSAFGSSCPNEQVRMEDSSAGLPDCRAYEMVSPPYKDGYFPFLAGVAPDGGRALFSSLGAFAGTKGNYVVEGSLYESTRTASGWVAKPVSPPASQFAFAQLQDASRNLDRTLWTAHTETQSADAEDLYVREPDGSFVLVGPQLPPSHDTAPPAPTESRFKQELKYAGANPQLSHIFFEIQPEAESVGDIAWPGDHTLPRATARSLYEYSGVGNSEPKLVGVLNKGRLNSNTEAEMITQCGVELGGGDSSSSYNAISTSGDTVFFTANAGGCENFIEPGIGPEVREIYARLKGSETIAISEPSSEECEECNTSSRERGIFVGASEDGTKAFFLSSQEQLLPGAAGQNLYEYVINGVPHKKLVRVSDEVSEPRVLGIARISKDGSHVYFVAEGVLANNKNGNGEEATEGANNLYVFDSATGTTSFIAMLAAEDSADWKKFDERPVQATPDGEFLIFPSRAHLTPNDSSGPEIAQLFEYDAATGDLVRLSIGQKGSYFCPATGKVEDGYNCNGNTDNATYAFSSDALILAFSGREFAKNRDGATLTPDGTSVLFTTFDSLAPQAVNGLGSELCSNVYEYHWSEAEGGMTNGNVSLISDGNDVAKSENRCGSGGYGFSPNGPDIFIESTDRLVSQDNDTQRDIYDAREGGGFPATIARPGCVGDACQGSLAIAPQLSGVGSSVQAGGGNVVSPQSMSVRAAKKKASTMPRAKKLTRALSLCKKIRKKKNRAICISTARKRYGGGLKSKKGSVSQLRVDASGRRSN